MERLKTKHFGQLFQLSFLVLITLLTSAIGSVFLLVGIFSDSWEMMKYNTTLLQEMKVWKNNTDDLEPQDPAFDGRVARLKPNHHNSYPSSKLISSRYTRTPGMQFLDTRWQKTKRDAAKAVTYLVPIRGGMLKYCVDLDEEALITLQTMGFYQEPCTYYLKASNDEEVDMSMRPSHYIQREHASMRIHNLALSCSLVCTIVLCSAAILGAFGLTRRQLSAVLITGVMYMLSAVFGLFALCMMYFKRRTIKDYILQGDVIPRDSPYIAARLFMVGNSLELSITGVVLNAIAAICWMLLSKLMRYNPIYLIY